MFFEIIDKIVQAVDPFLVLMNNVQQYPSVAGKDTHQFRGFFLLNQRYTLPDKLRAAPGINQVLAKDAFSI